MGFFRFILIFAMLIGHAHEGNYIPTYIFPYLQASGYYGAAKVHCFFLISGFFSDMLLSERLKKSSHYISDFYITRLIRLLPCYYVALLLTYWLVILGPEYGFKAVQANTISTSFFYDKFHQDGLLYILYNLIPLVPETLRFYDFSHTRGVSYLLVMPAWSLSIEYACLLIAPFIFRSKKLYILSLCILSLLAVILATKGLYRNYILNTTIFYLLGSLAYRVYRQKLNTFEPNFSFKIFIAVLITFLALYLAFFGLIATVLGLPVTYILFMIISVVSLPFLFIGSKTFLNDRRLFIKDRWIGDLAYPMYVNHALLLMVFGSLKIDTTLWYIIPAASIFFAVIMLYAIDQPLQRLRKKYYYQ